MGGGSHGGRGRLAGAIKRLRARLNERAVVQVMAEEAMGAEAG